MTDIRSPRPKLPFWASVGEAYRLTWQTLPKISGPMILWLAVTAIGAGLIEWALWEPPAADGDRVAPFGFFRIWSAPVFALLTGAAIAVPWHRLILQQNRSTALSSPLDGRVWRYVLWGLVGLIPTLLFFMAIDWITFTDAAPVAAAIDPGTPAETVESPETDTESPWLVFLFSIMMAMGAIPVFAVLCFLQLRFSMMLPAVAIEASSVGPRQAWAASSGNFWRLFWGTAATFGPFLLISLAWAFNVVEPESRQHYAARSAFDYTFLLLGGMVSVAFLSVAFRHFFPDAVEIRRAE